MVSSSKNVNGGGITPILGLPRLPLSINMLHQSYDIEWICRGGARPLRWSNFISAMAHTICYWGPDMGHKSTMHNPRSRQRHF
jgi:hypothetical protein